MGVGRIVGYDDDGVAPHNLPNQFYPKESIGQFKADALKVMLKQFTDVHFTVKKKRYNQSLLEEVAIVVTDSMASRRLVWDQFKHQADEIGTKRLYIEGRMGAETGQVFTVRRDNRGLIRPKDIRLYEAMLYDDSTVPPLPCTARTIIYNVLMMASWISGSLKAYVMNEKFPSEITFNLTQIDERSLMVN